MWNAVGIQLMVAEVNAVSSQGCLRRPTPARARWVPPVRKPIVAGQIGGLSGFGALPVDLKDLTHGHHEVVEIRTLAARRYELGVGSDGQV